MEAKSSSRNSTPSKKRAKKSSSPPKTPQREKSGTTPYKLREGSKLPSRYRDDVTSSPARTRSPAKTKSPTKAVSGTASPARRAFGGKTEPLESQPKDEAHSQHRDSQQQPSSSSTPFYQNRSQPSSVSNLSAVGGSDGGSTQSSAVRSLSPLARESQEVGSQPNSGVFPVSVDQAFHGFSVRKTKSEREREIVGERVGLKRLRHVLSLQKARRWSICEFFYSAVDEQLFLADNEFSQIMMESFPNIKTTMMNKQEWRTVRRLLGKPRRCSPQFFLEERQSLEMKRAKIRAIYDGSYITRPDYDISDLPLRLPRPLIVGMRVYARIHSPKDGIYGGNIDAVLKNGYRVIFEKEDMIPPLEVSDSQVMLDGRLELVPITYFIEQTSAKLPYGLTHNRLGAGQNALASSSQGSSAAPERRHEIAALAHNKMMKKAAPETTGTTSNVDKVGNFPVRMLVIIVKLSKLIDIKKRLVRQLSDLNAEAERANLLTDVYHPVFQEKYAQVVVDLESLNKQMAIYLQGIQEYNTQLLPHLTDSMLVARPEALRRLCSTHANQIVKHCNLGLNVTHPRALSLITALASLLLQIRSLGQQKLSAVDLQALGESMNEIRGMISPKNAANFQDNVEVHMKQIHNMMLQSGALTR